MSAASTLVQSIPDPAAIQERLGELAREESVLRRLLRVAIEAKKNRGDEQSQEEIARE